MDATQQKLIQYLNEAHATEEAVTRDLQSQIAMTPEGSYRRSLETHLEQTRDHARRVGSRLKDLGQGGNPVTAVVGVAEDVLGQAFALSKAPWNFLRGSGGDEKVLKNAKDASANETREIATYTAIERLARAAGDDETARLAVSIRGDEEQMLQRIMREIPKLTEAATGVQLIDEEPAPAPVRRNGARKKPAAPKRPAPRKPAPVPSREALRAAADQGDLQAAHQLGVIHWREFSDLQAAIEWLDRAAQADHPAAQRDLALVLREQGDLHGSRYWLTRAADRDAEARRVLAELG